MDNTLSIEGFIGRNGRRLVLRFYGEWDPFELQKSTGDLTLRVQRDGSRAKTSILARPDSLKFESEYLEVEFLLRNFVFVRDEILDLSGWKFASPHERLQDLEGVKPENRSQAKNIPTWMQASLLHGAEDPYDPDAALDITLGPTPKRT